MNQIPKVGDQVSVPWGVGTKVGIVVDVYGADTAKPRAVVELPVQGASGETLETNTVTFPVEAIEAFERQPAA